MRVGIVIPAYNVASYIGAAIGGVLKQTHRNWTLTIVDDGSTDGTRDIAGAFTDPRIRRIRQFHAGVSAARNRGLAETESDAVLFLDADDWLSPDALSTLAMTLRANPRAIATVGPYRRVPGRRVWRPPSGDLLELLLVRNLFANGGHVLIRREALATIGPFHPGLRYGEDWEYWTRLARMGTFAATGTRAPLLFVRERPGGACIGMAAHPESFQPCMDAIFGAPGLLARFGEAELTRLRHRAQAENDWIVGRELIRHGQWPEGRRFLRRSVRSAPCLRRVALLVAGSLPLMGIGPFRPYPTAGVTDGLAPRR